jgi:hypothetical protein
MWKKIAARSLTCAMHDPFSIQENDHVDPIVWVVTTILCIHFSHICATLGKNPQPSPRANVKNDWISLVIALPPLFYLHIFVGKNEKITHRQIE